MITKTPKSGILQFIKRGAAIVFVIEAVGFAGSYFIWHKTNTDRDFRLYLKQNYPSVLETYYKTGELIDSTSRIREVDQSIWNSRR